MGTKFHWVRLDSQSQIFFEAELFAQSFEVAGWYKEAKRLYERVLAVRRMNSSTTAVSIITTINDIERVVACRSAIYNTQHGASANAVTNCRQILTNIETSPTLDLKTKLAIVDTVRANITSKLQNGADIDKRAKQLRNEYKKEWQCLSMAEELNKGALKLELAGMYPMAEKLYKDALVIKRKNLGPNDPDTLSQCGDVARLSAEQGHISEAIALYEQTLTAYRKIPTKGESFCLLLQSYGDLLSRTKQTKKADRIYKEARAYYASSASPVCSPKKL